MRPSALPRTFTQSIQKYDLELDGHTLYIHDLTCVCVLYEGVHASFSQVESKHNATHFSGLILRILMMRCIS